MCRHFLIHPVDQNWQQSFWRKAPDEPAQVFCLKIVTYGTAGAPFLGNACLLSLANREQGEFSLGVQILHNHYAVDFFVAADSIEELREKVDQLIRLLRWHGCGQIC